MRTVIFGADGLTFRILHPLIERGDLPNFKRLREQGCEAVLESKYPPLTPPAWTSLSTGLKCARHGVYDFWTYEEQAQDGLARKARVQTNRKAGKALWNILSEYRKQVLVVNVPMTYPPEAVNGIMVSGYMTPSSEVNFTYPTSFKEELYRVVPDYQIDLELRGFFKHRDGLQRLIDGALAMTSSRIALIHHLLKEKPWDFAYVAFVGPDRLQHSLWQEISALDARATEYFRLLDRGLGLVLEQLGPEDVLFVVSDHGFQGATHIFNINEYLYRKGLLTPTSIHRLRRAYRTASLKQLLQRTKLLPLARKIKRALKLSGAVEFQRSDIYHPAQDHINLEQTSAYVPSLSGYGGSYVDIVLKKDIDPAVVAELVDDLKRQVDPSSGKRLVDALYTNEVYGDGPYALSEPHLLLLPNEGITFRMGLGSRCLWEEASHVRGTHQKDGVLYAYGGGIKQGLRAPNAQIYDLAPTVLHCMGLPSPHAFDGRVLDELFVAHGPSGQEVKNENGLARRKLKRLVEL